MRSTTSCRVSISWCFVFKASRPPAPPHACHRDGGRQWRSYPHNGQPEAPQTGRTTRWCRTRRRRPSRPKTLPAFTGPMRRTPAIVAARTTPERPHPALMSVCKNLRAPVKTGEVLRMKEPYGEGLASYTDSESCAGVREGGGEALTGVRAGRVLSREILHPSRRSANAAL